MRVFITAKLQLAAKSMQEIQLNMASIMSKTRAGGESGTLLQLFASQSEQLRQPLGQLLRVVYCEFVVSMQHNQRHHRQSAKQQQQQQLQQCCRCKCLSNCFNLRLFILCPAAAATPADVDDDDDEEDDEDDDDGDDDDDNKCTTLWPWRLVRLLD